MNYRRFRKSVQVAIIKRASRANGIFCPNAYCEKCGQMAVKFEIHHIREDALEVDKSKPLTAEDGVLWCLPCHDEHTRKFSTPAAALAKRQEAAALGAEKPNKQQIPKPPKPARSTFKTDQIRAMREAKYT